MNSETFEEFWNRVIDYCEYADISPLYAEEEFIIDGELNTVFIEFGATPTRDMNEY